MSSKASAVVGLSTGCKLVLSFCRAVSDGGGFPGFKIAIGVEVSHQHAGEHSEIILLWASALCAKNTTMPQATSD